MSLRHERDSTVQRLFTKYNLGSHPNTPLSNEVSLNLTNRIKSRLLDLEKDLQDVKVHALPKLLWAFNSSVMDSNLS